MVYLPMGYLYGIKATAKETPLLRELREVRIWTHSTHLCAPHHAAMQGRLLTLRP